jgi:hypothetical protein
VFGLSNKGTGVRGESQSGGVGVLGIGRSSAFAGRFEGAVVVTGAFLVSENDGRLGAPIIARNFGTVGDILQGEVSPGFPVFRVLHSGDVQVRGVTLNCDKNVKANFWNVNTRQILDRLSCMPIAEWSYKADSNSVRHIGPTSQDFKLAFGLNGDEGERISVVDAQGIALAAIQGLNEKLNAENTQLRANLLSLETRLAALESNLRAAGRMSSK